MANSREVEIALLDFTSKEAGALLLRAYQALTTGTPVDTGFVRGRWTPGVGSAISAASGKRPSSRSDAEREGRIGLRLNESKAKAIAATYRISQGDLRIVNPVDYLIFLNMGSSSQAASMFIERAVAQAVRASRPPAA